MQKISLTKWVENFCEDVYETHNTKTQRKAGWTKWKCPEGTLIARTEKLGMKLTEFYMTKRFKSDNVYVYFENIRWDEKKTFDKINICDLSTDQKIYEIIPFSPKEEIFSKTEIYGQENNFAEPIVVAKWEEAVLYFK